MDKKITGGLEHLDTVEACHAYIRDLQQRLEHLELEAELNPIRGDRPYKVLGFHCASMLSRDDGFGVYAEFEALAQAVDYCRQQIDGQIAHAMAEAEHGLLTTSKDIDDAIAELMHTGWCFWVSNVADPTAQDAFEARTYARARLTAAVMQVQSDTVPQKFQAAVLISGITVGTCGRGNSPHDGTEETGTARR
jgi:hypothetical protein